jgi:hypothetical protein
VTKQQRERVRRHAAVIAAASSWQQHSEPRPVEDAGDRWSGLRRWRGDDAEGEAEPRRLVISRAGAPDRFAKFWRD